MKKELELGFINFKKDAYIIIEGKQDADCFFIIKKGKVRITRDVAVKGEKDEILDNGDYFAVISSLSSHRHIETAQALTDVELITVKRQQLVPLIEKNADVAMKILTQFSKRLRYLNENLAKLTVKEKTEAGHTHLVNVAEYYAGQKQYSYAAHAYAMYIKHCQDENKAAMAKDRLKQIFASSPNPNSIEPKISHPANEQSRTYKKNTMMFSEGEIGEELFVIQKGSIKICKIVENNEVFLEILHAGDVVGEMALLEGKPRDASAIACEDCTVLVVCKTNFEFLSKTKPQLIAKITTLLAQRIWFVYKRLSNELIVDPLSRTHDVLFIHLEKNRVQLNSANPFTFNFGQQELANMAGLSANEASEIFGKMIKSKTIQLIDGKICASSVRELVKLTRYYQNMDDRRKKRDN